MNENDLNAVMALVVSMGASTCILFWISPQGLDWLVKRLKARSEALRRAREVYRDTHRAAMMEPAPEQTAADTARIRRHYSSRGVSAVRHRAKISGVEPDVDSGAIEVMAGERAETCA